MTGCVSLTSDNIRSQQHVAARGKYDVDMALNFLLVMKISNVTLQKKNDQ